MEEARDILLLLGREGSTGALGQSSGRAGSSNDGSTTPTPSSTVPSTSPTPLNSLDSLRRTVSDALPRRSPVQVEFINPIYVAQPRLVRRLRWTISRGENWDKYFSRTKIN